MRAVAVIELEVGEDAGLFIRTVGLDVGTFVRDVVDETTRLVLALERPSDKRCILPIGILDDRTGQAIACEEGKEQDGGVEGATGMPLEARRGRHEDIVMAYCYRWSTEW